MGTRVDAVVIYEGIIFVIEFKMGARQFDTGAIDQVIPHRLLRAVSHALACSSHRQPPMGYDDPEILSYAIRPLCPTSADGLQSWD